MISNAKMAELRDVIREILDPYIAGDVLEELVVGIAGAARIAFSDEESLPKRRGTAASMFAGLNRIETIKAKLADRFKLNYPWQTKHGQDMLEWLSGRPETETIDEFADWWWADAWRRERKGAPSLTEIYTHWPRAFSTPDYGGPKVAVYRADAED